MGCLWTAFRRISVGFCAFCKLGLSIAIIVIVATELHDQGVIAEYITIGPLQNVPVIPACLMGNDDSNEEFCQYAYAVSSVSMFVSFCLSLFLCITCDGCGGGAWIEFIVGGLLTAWWACAAIVFSTTANWANDRNWPRESYRNSIPIMSWTAMLLAGIQTFVYAIDAIRCCVKCCCDDDRHKGKGADQHHEHQTALQPGVPPAQQMGKDDPVRANAV